jgi:hypothetical protein
MPIGVRTSTRRHVPVKCRHLSHVSDQVFKFRQQQTPFLGIRRAFF